MSCARPVISERHFGHVLEWRSSLKILNWKSIKKKVSMNMKCDDMLMNKIELSQPTISTEKVSVATLENLSWREHLFQAHLTSILYKIVEIHRRWM